MSTFNVCYLRWYTDPECESETFAAYETIYRNVPNKYLKKFTNQNLKMKMLKHCDWNYKDMATNYTNVSNIEIITEKEYYQTYEDVFGETAQNDKTLFNDYGQQWDRQSLRKDFDVKKTHKHVQHYNDKRVN